MNGDMVVDLFAGPGGWDEGMTLLPWPTLDPLFGTFPFVVGLERDDAACRTAVAAGHTRIRCDIASYPTAPFVGKVGGLIASPPCQAWSRSGKRGGLLDQPAIFAHVAACTAAEKWLPYDRDGWHDERSPLVLEVLRWTWALRPRWIACEQVEDVLPFWHEVARWLRTQGYSAWAGVLNAEEYGVPQTRRRAILVARRDGVPASPPAATHRRYFPPKRAKAADLVAGDDLFGTELLPWVSMADALGWTGEIEMHHQRGRGMAERHGERPGRSIEAPSQTITGAIGESGGSRLTWVLKNSPMDNASERTADEPAGTIYCSRPVQGDPRIGRPGHKDREGGEAQFAQDSVRVSVQEAAVLQGFRPDYPWAGNKGDQYRQVGDAVPPPLAAAILAPLLTSVCHRAEGAA